MQLETCHPGQGRKQLVLLRCMPYHDMLYGLAEALALTRVEAVGFHNLQDVYWDV